MSETKSSEYKLSAVLGPHRRGVRAIGVVNDNNLVNNIIIIFL